MLRKVEEEEGRIGKAAGHVSKRVAQSNELKVSGNTNTATTTTTAHLHQLAEVIVPASQPAPSPLT